MPSAPASSHSAAAVTGSGYTVPRALRIVATWSMLMWSRIMGWCRAAFESALGLMSLQQRKLRW